jgi:chromosome partitioning protein
MDDDLRKEQVVSTILSEHSIDLLPSNILLANAEQELIFAELRELRLKQVLNLIDDDYDFILIDCPPSLGILSIISLVASTHILIPIQCQFKSLIGTDSLLSTVAKIRKRLNPQLKIAGFLPTMFQKSNSLDNRTLDAINEQLSEVATVFSPMPRATAVAEASEMGKPLALCSNKHKTILELLDLLATTLEEDQ